MKRITNYWQDTKIELESKMLERIRGVMFRSKVKWYEEGEKNTRYFYSLEKIKYNAKTCFKTIDEEGHEIIEPHKILDIQKQFYTKLYQEDEGVSFSMENQFNIYVPGKVKEQQNNQITLRDLEEAIKTMNNQKTPGSDGIPVEFYKTFWCTIKDLFYDMMQNCFSDSLLHDTAREGILNLIPKAGKDTRFIKNLRPITLLNTDYKIIEKAVANKMIPALEDIISHDQRGFMKNRRISVNIRKLLDIMHYADKHDIEAVILSLDFVKCFDKCSFSILHGSLDFFGFGQIIKDWTKILYKDFSVKIQNNGYFSDPIKIKKGVHQGGCCSSVYFLVIAEILALALRGNHQIKGISIKEVKHLLNQFADDMDIGSVADKQSLVAIFNELDSFRSQSGFTVSYEKTTLYRIGSLKYSNAKMYDLEQYRWSNEDITVLGIKVAHENILQKNYEGIIEKSKMILESWYNRGLSLIGKVQVVNTLIASLFVYKMMVLEEIPVNIVRGMDNLIRNFIWNGRKAKIAYSILQNPKKEGGLGLVNLKHKDISLKATWPKILSTEQEYASLVYVNMRCITIKEDIWRCSLLPEHIQQFKGIPVFWLQVLKAWSSYNFLSNVRVENQLIWYNSQILIKDKPFIWNDLYKKGLRYVYQLFEKGCFKSFDLVWEQYGLSKLRYNSLKAAIPESWKEFFCTNPVSTFFPLPPHNYDMMLNKANFTKEVYNFIAGDASLFDYKYRKWEQELGVCICDSIWQFGQLHMDVYSITNIAKYRSFQYRLLQRGLVTNVQLLKWGILQSNLCSFCSEDVETITHLIYQCPVVKRLWHRIEKYLKEEFGIISVKLGTKEVIMNRIVEPKRNVGNFVCLLTKQYIYRQRCIGEHLNKFELTNHIKRIELIEKYIAIKNGKLNVHLKKWGKMQEGHGVITENISNSGNNTFIQQYLTDL